MKNMLQNVGFIVYLSNNVSQVIVDITLDISPFYNKPEGNLTYFVSDDKDHDFCSNLLALNSNTIICSNRQIEKSHTPSASHVPIK